MIDIKAIKEEKEKHTLCAYDSRDHQEGIKPCCPFGLFYLTHAPQTWLSSPRPFPDENVVLNVIQMHEELSFDDSRWNQVYQTVKEIMADNDNGHTEEAYFAMIQLFKHLNREFSTETSEVL